MKTLFHQSLKLLSLTVGVMAIISATSCSRDDDATRNGGRRELAIDVHMIGYSEWQSRSDGGVTAQYSSKDVEVLGSKALDEQLEIVAQSEPIGYTPDVPLSRGTPVSSVSALQSMGIAIYTDSNFTKFATATNSAGSWRIDNNLTLDLDLHKYSYYAYAPVSTADNGIVVQSDGKKLVYTAPATAVSKQPDLCFAKPVIDDKTGSVTFDMQHALTSVGIKIQADNVEIGSIKLLDVQTSGTLDLTKTTSTWTNYGPVADMTFSLSTKNPGTGGGIANITASSGYLMLPPQALNVDSKKLEIIYRYTGETAWRTGTHSLNTITGGAPWVAGQAVNYVIRLKAKFALDLNKYSDIASLSAGSYTALSYTTNSLSSKDPQVSCDASWVTALKVNYGSSGKGTITFNYDQNGTGTSSPRKAKITVTSGYTSKDFELTQIGEHWINLSSQTPPEGKILSAGGTFTTQVSVPLGVPWKVESASNCTVTPSSGTETTNVTITVPQTATARDVSAVFATQVSGIAAKKSTWSGKQPDIPTNCFATPIPGYPTVYVALSDYGSGKYNFANAKTGCITWGGRLPSIYELQALQPKIVNNEYGAYKMYTGYWSQTPWTDQYYNINFNDKAGAGRVEWAYGVRCVKDAK